MMGVAIDGATHVYGDNMSIIKNTSKPESTLNKKSNTVCYHAVRESLKSNRSTTSSNSFAQLGFTFIFSAVLDLVS